MHSPISVFVAVVFCKNTSIIFRSVVGRCRQKLLCDVLVVAGDTEISAHRAVLASCSPYFYAMFTGELAESKADRIVLQEIDGRALALLIDFIYMAEVSVTEDNVQVRR